MSPSATQTRTIADYVAQELVAHQVRHVFGYPGASVIPLMGSIHRNRDLHWVTFRNEANAALAAAAQAKLTGRPAVCVATSGPGASNMITGLLDAQLDSAPLVAITGQVGTWRQGRSEFQDVDAARLLGQFVPYSVACSHPQELPALLRECLGRSLQERCVTHLALPADIQKTAIPMDGAHFAVGATQPSPQTLPPESELSQAVEQLEAAKSVVLAVGPGARGCGPALERLASKLNLPILTAFNAKGVIAEDHPCCVGVLGIFGSPGSEVSSQILSGADLVLAFGLRDIGPFVETHGGIQARALIQCELDSYSLSHRFHRSASLLGPLEPIAASLESRVRPKDEHLLGLARRLSAEFFKLWTPSEGASSCVHPVRFLSILSSFLDEHSVVAFDIGDNAVWTAQFLRLCKRQPVLVSENLGVMGFALPALIAARLERPEGRLVGIVGDGGVQMSIGELAVAVQHGLGFVLVVFNNGVLGRIQAQEESPFLVKLHSPDYAALARAYGAAGEVVDGHGDLNAALERAFAHTGSPYLLELRLDPALQAPMGGWQDGFVPLHFT